MAVDMVMPKMGESITEGTILQWLKKEGDPVERDEVILEISTDKVDSEIPSPSSGVLAKILVPAGETVEVGQKIAEIQTDASELSDNGQAEEVKDVKPAAEKPAATPQQTAPASTAPAETVADDAAKPPAKDDRFYSPLVRSIAAKEGVTEQELASIPGSGMHGRVNKEDILAHIENRKAAPAMPAAPSVPAPTPPAGARMPQLPATAPAYSAQPGEVIEMDNMRKSIAEHMVRSVQTSPHVYSFAEADVSHLVKYREAVKNVFAQKEGFKLTYTPFFIHAVAKALRDFPMVNSSVDGTKIILKKNVNIGTAVAIPSGLIVPVVKNADMLNLLGIARSLDDLANRARTKKLMPDEVQAGTFTITNVGSFGNLYGTPIINQPQVAILGVGVIQKRVVVVNDAIAVRDMVYISLGYDHRIIDGALGGGFLQRVVKYLEEMNPEQI
ncbi:MAG: 2-oxo acid dehydrogenase subunit E2 [Deferribacteres bacterium]|nr:2-oxo acid dehydrogenase subunit E2 [Deferribacteres bacterium]